MTEANTIQVTQDDSTENYTIYESADGSTVVGAYVANAAAEQLGEYAELVVGADEGRAASKKKDTSNYGVYESEPAVSGIYISHDALDSEETDDGPVAPDEVSLLMNVSDEESFESAIPSEEEAADELVGDADGSDEEDEESEEEAAAALVGEAGDAESESPSENVEISDEEIGLDD